MSKRLREDALRLLARREHTRQELKRKLSSKALSEKSLDTDVDTGVDIDVDSSLDVALDALLDELTSLGLLSDQRYAEMRTHVRSSRLGNLRIREELRQAGVSEAIAEEALSHCSDERARALQVWKRKFGERPAPNDLAERSRQMRFLMQRGFSRDTIRAILDRNTELESLVNHYV